jgi:hypothetical protein
LDFIRFRISFQNGILCSRQEAIGATNEGQVTRDSAERNKFGWKGYLDKSMEACIPGNSPWEWVTDKFLNYD